MSIEKMRLVKINGDGERLQEVLNTVLASECFQPEPAGKFFTESLGLMPYSDNNAYSQVLAEMQTLIKENNYTPALDPEEAKKPLTDEEIAHINSLLEKSEDYARRRAVLTEQKTKCEEGIVKFSHFTGLSVNLDEITDLTFVKVRFGHLPKESTAKLNAVSDTCPYFYFVPCSTDKTDCWGVYFAPRNRIDEVDGIFAMLLFEPFSVPGAAGTVDSVIKELKNNLEIIDGQLRELAEEAKQIGSIEHSFFDSLYSKLTAVDEVQQLKSYALHNDHYFMMAGWVPESEEKSFLEALKGIESVSVQSGKPDAEKTPPPVKIKKRRGPLKYLIDPYNFYIDMYGTPSYGDTDITGFVAITYTLLFGIMFGDVGQGFVLSIIGYLMYKLKGMGLGKILIPCGISSMLFGFLFGSVFGYEHLLDPVYHALGWEGKPLEVMESVNTVLLIAIGIGVALTAVSILIGIYGSVRRKQYGEAIFSQNGLVGLILYLAGANLASGFMGGPAPLPNSAAGAILGVCALLLFIKEIPIGIIDKHPDWKPESWLDFVLQNVFELLEYILSYLSNTVSFLRVGAFVLVHAGMMMVVFSLAGESQNIFVIILGNVLVIALEGLLTGIQALRLEYYEMFSRFYSGDGKPFTPFSNKKLSIGGNK